MNMPAGSTSSPITITDGAASHRQQARSAGAHVTAQVHAMQSGGRFDSAP